MKKRSKVIGIGILLVVVSLVLTGCLTTGSETRNQQESLFAPVRKAPALMTMEGSLYDVNTAEVIGDFSLEIVGESFNLEVNVEATQGVTSYDGTFDYEPYTGSFTGIREDFNENYVLVSEKNEDEFYAVIHDYNDSYQFLFEKDLPENENVYLISIFNEEVGKIVFDKESDNYNPIFSIHALKPHIRTHAVILVSE